MSVEQSAKLVDAALIGSVEDGADRLLHLRRMGVARLQVAGENLDRFVPAGLGDLVDGAPVGIGRAGSKPAAKARRIVSTSPARRRVEDTFAFELRGFAAVDVRFELPPTGEAVFARQRQLDRGELGLRVLLAQRLETLLGLVPEMLEARAFRQRSGATRSELDRVSYEPSFHMRPASANFGQEVRLCSIVACRRAAPFTRTVGRRYGRHQNSETVIRSASPRAAVMSAAACSLLGLPA